jgi:hypothetical protein
MRVSADARGWERWIAGRKSGASQKSAKPKRIGDYRKREKLKLCTAKLVNRVRYASREGVSRRILLSKVTAVTFDMSGLTVVTCDSGVHRVCGPVICGERERENNKAQNVRTIFSFGGPQFFSPQNTATP